MAVPWEFLREPVAVISTFAPLFDWLVLIVAGVLLGIAIMAYKKSKSRSIFWVGVAFGLFSLKALLVVLDYYVSPGYFFNYAIQSFFDLLILGCLFLALFRK